MKIYIARRIIQLLAFLLLIYGAYLGLRFSNFAPLWRCPNQNTYSDGCYLIPFHRIQYGASVFPGENRGMPFPGYLILEKGKAYLSFFLFLIIGAIIFNKVWCGWFCPFGTMQDFLNYIKRKLKLREITLSRKAKYIIPPLKYIFLILLFGGLIIFAFGIPVDSPLFCKACPAKTMLLPLEGNLLNFSVQFPHDTVASIVNCVIAGFVLAAVFLKQRFFCFFCPIKGLLNLFNTKIFWHLRKNPGNCNFCARCQQACPMDIKEVCLEKKSKSIFHKECIFCLRCIDACPKKGVLKAQLFKK